LPGAARPPPAESEMTGVRLEPKPAGANSPVVACLFRLTQQSDADAEAVAANAGAVARLVRGNIYPETESLDPGPSSFVRRTGSSAPRVFSERMRYRCGWSSNSA
jgi:hypothetical protein